MTMTFSTSTHTGLVRHTNEDSCFARPPVFVVADGMGGAQAGEVASAMAAQAFEYFLPQSSRPNEELAKLIQRTNSSIYEYAMGDAGRAGMGTTITAAVVSGDSVIVAHVGDSRAWLMRGGELIRLTEDHSLVAEMLREGQLTEKEAADHPQRSVITRAMGVEPSVDVDTNVVKWQPGDIILLASDGLHSLVPEADIAAVVSSAGNLAEAAEELVEAANSRGGNDNVTVVLFCPDGSVPGQGAGAGMAVLAPGGRTGETSPGGSAIEAGSRDKRGVRSFLLRAVIGALLAVVILGAAWLGSRQLFYVGVAGNQVVVYRGVPYDLGPVQMSSIYRGSSVVLSNLEPYEQDRVLAYSLQSRSNAESMLDNLIIADRERREEERHKREEKDNDAAAGTSPAPARTS
ncbi:MAG: Stp1/IreP family PP2C-type Ser/Thr phosphatase [Thermoleophilia bacterium]|nr:Stp1/IreP family PP2C-type Ser/Thr phosphatase [Thermoleophilia bacterium]